MKILFVHNSLTRFVQIDLNLLRERYIVNEWYQKTRFVNLPALVIAVVSSDLVFGWFASWHTFFPILLAWILGKPSVVVVGGYDTANMPEIGYGSMRGGGKQWIARTILQLATRLVAFSEFSRYEAICNGRVDASRVKRIYIGVPSQTFDSTEKELLAITTGNVDHDNLKRKGIESFVRAAALLPDIPFVVMGAWRDESILYLQSIASANVKFTNWVSDSELGNYFTRARVYVQASQHEGFGLAVAEAMLAECVPVVTRAGALPEVVGDCGVYIDSPSPQAIADGVRQVLKMDSQAGHRVRIRIEKEFALERRREQLFALINQLVQ